MTAAKKGLEIDKIFDRRNCRHFLNGTVYVLHCHHYSTLYCRLADDAEIFDGKKLLRQACEMSFLPEISKIFERQNPETLEERLRLVEDYFRFVGLGLLRFESVGPMASTVCMDRSHVDEGWIKKWGKRDKPVNFIGQGFLAAAMAAVFDMPAGAFRVEEQESIVSGAKSSKFTLVRQ